MKSVLISIQPQWVEKILKGDKTVEVRKTRPKLEPPFKCYIYCTQGKKTDALLVGEGQAKLMCCSDYTKAIPFGGHIGNGKIVGEFVCDKLFDICIEISKPEDLPGCPFPCTGLTDKEILQYLGNGETGYGWHISDLVIYEKPMLLSDIRKPCNNDMYCEVCAMYFEMKDYCGNAALKLERPPQSWCYVENWDHGGL